MTGAPPNSVGHPVGEGIPVESVVDEHEEVIPSQGADVRLRGPKGARRATAGAPEQRPRRWSARRKLEIVLRHMRGENLDALAREMGQPASRIAQWQDRVLSGADRPLPWRRSRR